jgi:hypothetical protein
VLMARTNLGIALVVALAACGGRTVDEWTEPVPVADAGADAAPEAATTCCRLDNESGERLDYLCTATATLNIEWAVERGYRCWSVP